MYPNKLKVMQKVQIIIFLSVRIIYHLHLLNNGNIYSSKKMNDIISIK